MEFNEETEQNRNRLIDTENRLTAVRGLGDWEKKGKGIKQHKLVIAE